MLVNRSKKKMYDTIKPILSNIEINVCIIESAKCGGSTFLLTSPLFSKRIHSDLGKQL